VTINPGSRPIVSAQGLNIVDPLRREKGWQIGFATPLNMDFLLVGGIYCDDATRGPKLRFQTRCRRLLPHETVTAQVRKLCVRDMAEAAGP